MNVTQIDIVKKLQENRGKKNLKNTSTVDITADSVVAGGGELCSHCFTPLNGKLLKEQSNITLGGTSHDCKYHCIF